MFDWDFFKFLGSIFLAIGLLLGLCMASTIPFTLTDCRVYSDAGLDTRWELFGGCYVEVEAGYWIPSGEVGYWRGQLNGNISPNDLP